MEITYTVPGRVGDLLHDAKWLAWSSKAEQSGRDWSEPDPFGLCESPSLRIGAFVRLGQEDRYEDERARSNRKLTKYASRGPEVTAVVACCNKNASLESAWNYDRDDGAVFIARLKSRLIVNQAGGILENAGLCLHPHYGFPFIPGSAVKGIARHAAWCAWQAELDPEKKAKLAEEIAVVFGYPTGDKRPKEKAEDREYLDDYLQDLHSRKDVPNAEERPASSGCIVFHAGCPVKPADGSRLVEVDIVTPHGNGNPVPNAFPTVAKGVDFAFTLSPLRRGDMGETEQRYLLQRAEAFLKEGLTVLGAGAKTAAGYGWFECLDDHTTRDALDAQRKNRLAKAEERQRALEAFRVDLARRNVDLKTVAVDEAVHAELQGMSQTKFKELFKENARLEDPVFRRTLFECCRTDRRSLWDREKRNENGAICRKMNAWAADFGEDLP